MAEALPARLHQPVLGRMGVGQGLLGGECLGRDDEQRGLRVQRLEGLHDMRPVDVGDEMGVEAGFAVRAQGLGDHHGAQVRAADADVDHVGDGFAAVALPVAAANGVGEGAHPPQDLVDLGHHVLAVHFDGGIVTVAQGHMQHRPVLGEVDLFAREHALDPIAEAHLPRQVQQQGEGLIGETVLGIIEQQIIEADRILVEALRIVVEQLAHMDIGHLRIMRLQRLPGLQLIQPGHDQYASVPTSLPSSSREWRQNWSSLSNRR